MHAAVMAHAGECSIIIKSAAVADYRPVERNGVKIKKDSEEMTLKLVKNPDILAELGRLKRRPFLVGFAAETGNLKACAAKKLEEKNLDMIVANDVSQADAGFDVDTNRALLLFRDGREAECHLMTKNELADIILDHISAELESQKPR
jgi:phosphopantothenoylcysteine decarboxylase/phosphopantothenate--cysteine ligase